jgi:heterodisulfide reductase subunit B
MSVDATAAYALIGRNLALASDQNDNGHLISPCSACFLNLSKTDKYMTDSPKLENTVNEALAAGGLHYNPGSLKIRHLLHMIVEDVGFDAISEKVSRPLYGLRVAPYYGCLVVRPAYQAKHDDPEYPTSMDELLQVLGSEVIDYPLKTHCCGGHMTQISEATAMDLLNRLLKSASEYYADVIVTLCPMCQMNLDAYQDSVNRYFGTDYQIPILYFTQLMGLAFGIDPKELGIGKEIIESRPALRKISEEAIQAPRKERLSKEALPMPRNN